jgi:hypothetical protein
VRNVMKSSACAPLAIQQFGILLVHPLPIVSISPRALCSSLTVMSRSDIEPPSRSLKHSWMAKTSRRIVSASS